MLNLTLISTVHEDSGICTSSELANILFRIRPQVIFEEIPPSFYKDYYLNKTKSNLETRAICELEKNNQVSHIPVDYYNLPQNFFEDNAYLHKRIERISHDYRSSIDKNAIYVKEYGFKYLNSDYSIKVNYEIYEAVRNALESINEIRLNRIFGTWNEVNDERENKMIENIYNHCEENDSKIGVFLIGAAHRRSVINKINKYDNADCSKIYWNYSKYEDCI